MDFRMSTGSVASTTRTDAGSANIASPQPQPAVRGERLGGLAQWGVLSAASGGAHRGRTARSRTARTDARDYRRRMVGVFEMPAVAWSVTDTAGAQDIGSAFN